MSHFSKIKTEIDDINILKKVLDKFSYQHDENNTIKDYRGVIQNVDIRVLTDNSNYQIGFQKQQDGLFSIVADWYGIKSINQKNLNEEQFKKNIMKHYGFEKAKANIPGHFEIIEEEGQTDQEVLRIRLRRIY